MTLGFQSLIYGLTELLGLQWGVAGYRWIFGFATILIWMRVCQNQNLPWRLSILSSLVLLYGVGVRLIARPETMSFPLDIGYMLLALQFLEKEFSWKKAFVLLGFLWGWTWIHVSCVMGYLVLGAFGIHRSIRFPNEFLRWVTVGAISFLLGFLNPSFSHPFAPLLTMTWEWSVLISEMFPTPIHEAPLLHRVTWVAFLILGLFCLYRRFWLAVVVLGVLLYQTAIYLKAFPHLVILGVPIGVYFIRHEFSSLRVPGIPSLFRRRLYELLYLGVCIGFGMKLFQIALNVLPYSSSFKPRHPVAIADYLAEHQFSGAIFNTHRVGGYLIYRLGPVAKVVIDGRTNILYPFNFLRDYSFASYSQNRFNSFLKQMLHLNDSWVMVVSTHGDTGFFDRGIQSNFFHLLYEEAGWALLVPSKKLQREIPLKPEFETTPRFKQSEVLFAEPRCVKFLLSEKLDGETGLFQEWKTFQERKIRNSEFGLFLEFLIHYLRSPNSIQYLKQKHPLWLTSDRVLRLASLLAEHHQESTLALSFRLAVSQKKLSDQNFILKKMISGNALMSAVQFFSSLEYGPGTHRKALEASLELSEEIAKTQTQLTKQFEWVQKRFRDRIDRAPSFDWDHWCEERLKN